VLGCRIRQPHSASKPPTTQRPHSLPTATSAQMTSRPQCGQNAEHKYSHYFSQQRAEPPVDVTVSTSITRHSDTRPAGCATKIITLFNPGELYAVLGNNVRLDKAFVENILNTYGPILRPRDVGDWSFYESPSSVPPVANTETECYAWYLWLVASHVAHASNAVCYVLNLRGANIDIHGVMRADEVRRTIGGGATDIVQRLRGCACGSEMVTVQGRHHATRTSVDSTKERYSI
jgi:hypothetical protein